MSTDTSARVVKPRPTHRTVAQLIALARQDTDAVSCFPNGHDWPSADCAVFVVKDGERAKAVYEMLLRQGLITEGKGVAA